MFVLAKLFDLLMRPLNLLTLVLALGVILLWTRRASWGRRLVTAVLVAMGVIVLLPWQGWLLTPLEDRFPQPVLPSRVDGIIALGGGVDALISAGRGQTATNEAGERLTALAVLARRYPLARIVYSSGSNSLLWPEVKEAPAARNLLVDLGLDERRIIIEQNSRTTRDNALFCQEILQPKPGEVWLVVTSAVHMPRAMGAFRAIGWPVIAYPVDYLTPGPSFPVTATTPTLGRLEAALHEWIGLAYYRWRGWSDDWFPAP